MQHYYWIIGLLIVQCTGLTKGSTVEKLELQDFRLPTSLFPTHYKLRLQPILDETPGFTRFTAPGSVTISVNCTEDTSTIKLHALDITILQNSVVVTDVKNNQTISISGFENQVDYHFFVINLDEPLQVGGQYDILIEFVIPVSQTRLNGMYLDSYVDPGTNETRYVATTLFAAISARRCFPSFDEPQFKAVFSIELVRKEGYHALSNRHQISTEPMDGMSGWYVDKFAPSLPMSTYLVAMIVSDLTYEEAIFINNDAEETTIKVYAPYYFINRGGGKYAANQTQTVLAGFENYFNSTFMLSKLDSVSLPQFEFSAMENWGLITYKDSVLLYFPGETTEQERYRITEVIAHEVGHHYFGNLVTCEWWTWIWLNEGGATYFSYFGVEMTYPEFNPWDRFITDVFQVAMAADDTPEAHPVANEPTSLADIGGIYDDIAYRKGASLLRMMQSFLTEEVMQTAIRQYLKEKQFSNARQDDLFQILQTTAEGIGNAQPVSVIEIMDTWTKLSGYPILRVSRINSSEVLITQEKFQSIAATDANEEMWWIPVHISVVSPAPKSYFFWISNNENQTTFSIPDTEVFVLNPKSQGYYRTMYSSELLQGILQASTLNCTSVSSATKAKLIDDYFTFTNTGTGSTTDFNMNNLCLEQENLVVWNTVLKYYTRELLELYQKGKFDNADMKQSIKRDLLPAINAALEEMQTEKQLLENVETRILQAELIFWTCFIDADQPECKSYVDIKMRQWLSSTKEASPFPLDAEDTYLCLAASISDEYWEKIFEYMESRLLTSAKSRIASALMCNTNPKLLQRISPHLKEDLEDFIGKLHSLQLPVKAEKLPFLRATLWLLFNESGRKILF